jgi:hypothetical protein
VTLTEHLRELVARCDRGIEAIRVMEADLVSDSVESFRLRGKADGIHVVRSWLQAELRSMGDGR